MFNYFYTRPGFMVEKYSRIDYSTGRGGGNFLCEKSHLGTDCF